MRLTRLSLRDFRNYTDADVELRPGATLLVGRNGQGKTNFVEAIGYLSTLSSHRVADDAALVRSGADFAIIRAALAHGDRSTTVELQLNRRGANRAQLGGVPLRPRELPRHVATVQFAPEDLALVRGEPATRRRFLDELAIHLRPRLAGVIGDYERALKQRNSLLKSARASRVAADQLSTLDAWDDRLVALGSEIVAVRLALVGRLADPVLRAYRGIAGDEQQIVLRPRLSVRGSQPEDESEEVATATGDSLDREAIESAFRAALAEQRRNELDRGITLVGPHRDDLLLELNGLPARGYASHGESWSLALALRLASAELLRIDSPLGDPVIILDDVFAELDEGRRGRLAEAIADFEQILITAAVEGDVPPSLAGRRLRVRSGVIEEES